MPLWRFHPWRFILAEVLPMSHLFLSRNIHGTAGRGDWLLCGVGWQRAATTMGSTGEARR
jgi:hypothetical protein